MVTNPQKSELVELSARASELLSARRASGGARDLRLELCAVGLRELVAARKWSRAAECAEVLRKSYPELQS